MLNNMIPRTPVEIVERTIEFTSSEGWGYSFAANENGEVILENDAQRQNYEHAMAHPEDFDEEFNQFTVRRRTYMEPARGTCICGAEVVLENQYQGACQCPGCGAWYNLFGQSLIDPKFWED